MSDMKQCAEIFLFTSRAKCIIGRVLKSTGHLSSLQKFGWEYFGLILKT